MSIHDLVKNVVPYLYFDDFIVGETYSITIIDINQKPVMDSRYLIYRCRIRSGKFNTKYDFSIPWDIHFPQEGLQRELVRVNVLKDIPIGYPYPLNLKIKRINKRKWEIIEAVAPK